MIPMDDNDDGFALIERENSMKGQPYNWEADAIKAAIRIEREECAKLCDELDALNWSEFGEYTSGYSKAIRARGQV